MGMPQMQRLRNIPHYINHVDGNREMGCFVACVAMLLGKSYDETFKIIFPRRSPNNILGGALMPENAFMVLEYLGFKPRRIRIKKLKELNRHALIWVRWTVQNSLMHSVVFEASTRRFWDPNYIRPLKRRQRKNMKRQIDTVIYLDGYNPPKNKRIKPPRLPKEIKYNIGSDIIRFPEFITSDEENRRLARRGPPAFRLRGRRNDSLEIIDGDDPDSRHYDGF